MARILIAEDEPAVRTFLIRALESQDGQDGKCGAREAHA